MSRQPSTNRGERPLGKPNLPISWSWASNLQSWEKRSVCCLRHPTCSILLWQPKQTNTGGTKHLKVSQVESSYPFPDSGLPPGDLSPQVPRAWEPYMVPQRKLSNRVFHCKCFWFLILGKQSDLKHTHTHTQWRYSKNSAVEYPMASGYCSLLPSPLSSSQKQKRRYLTFTEQVKNCDKPTHWKRPWCWERLKAGGEGGDRGWDGWMASPTRWTWVWANSGRRWRTGKPGVLQSMESQRVRHDWATEQQQILLRRLHFVQKRSDSEAKATFPRVEPET